MSTLWQGGDVTIDTKSKQVSLSGIKENHKHLSSLDNSKSVRQWSVCLCVCECIQTCMYSCTCMYMSAEQAGENSYFKSHEGTKFYWLSRLIFKSHIFSIRCRTFFFLHLVLCSFFLYYVLFLNNNNNNNMKLTNPIRVPGQCSCPCGPDQRVQCLKETYLGCPGDMGEWPLFSQSHTFITTHIVALWLYKHKHTFSRWVKMM